MAPKRDSIVRHAFSTFLLAGLAVICGCGESEPPKVIDTTTDPKPPVGGPPAVKVQPKGAR